MERAGRIIKKKPLEHTISESSSATSLSSKTGKANNRDNDEVSVASESSSPAQKTVGLVIIGGK